MRMLKMRKSNYVKGIILASAIALGGCASIASGLSTVATEISTSTPTQVKTLAEAERTATLITKAVTIVVKTGKLNRGQLEEIRRLSDAVYAALDDLNTAQKSGSSLVYVSFNAALDAFNAYATQQGIAH